MKTHKYKRGLKPDVQIILCTGKKATFKEKGLSYFWSNVTCKACLKAGGK